MTEERKQEIERRLKRGDRRSGIARALDVSPSTITRWARILGFPDVRPIASKTDWASVQKHYDAGHTIDECCARFGFTYGAWDKAATRGDVAPRPRANGELGLSTRDRVEDLLSRGRTQAEISRVLGLTKSTIAYHVRQLGIRADPKFARRHDWEAVQRAIDDEGLSMAQCLKRFGFGRDTWYRAVKRGAIVPAPHLIPLEELLVVGRPTSRGHLKRRLILAGLKEDRCERCGLTEWEGGPISIQLHHRNGDGTDNRLSNLGLLCPNCHAQTPNWGGRNRRRRPHLRLVSDEDAA
jgi:DNA-binding CsgD family transcriptional regulator